jgi:electron transport complex protein RnfG
MKEIIRITIGLTVSCLIAAFVMGSVFAITDKAKKHNEHMKVQKTMLGLLGYSKSNKPPADLKLHTIYRYVLEENNKTTLGYLVPVVKDGNERYKLLIIDLDGSFAKGLDIPIEPEKTGEAPERKKALVNTLGSSINITYGNEIIIATLGKERLAYLLPGDFPGFKTFVKVMIALDPSFKIIGLEIMEHEEDPGLGGEIEKDYFKNQFVGKTFETLSKLKVVKEPMPEEYVKILEAKKKAELFSRAQIEEIMAKYEDHDIYALTGATISSRAVTSGVRSISGKFAYRIKILDGVIRDQAINPAF